MTISFPRSDMSRADIIIRTDSDRERAALWARRVPVGTTITFKKPQRTTPQNKRFWAMCTDVASQALHFGRKYPSIVWRSIFMHELGYKTEFVPTLDGSSVIPTGYHSSSLTVEEMSDLMAFIESWCAENAVTLNEPAQEEAVA